MRSKTNVNKTKKLMWRTLRVLLHFEDWQQNNLKAINPKKHLEAFHFSFHTHIRKQKRFSKTVNRPDSYSLKCPRTDTCISLKYDKLTNGGTGYHTYEQKT